MMMMMNGIMVHNYKDIFFHNDYGDGDEQYYNGFDYIEDNDKCNKNRDEHDVQGDVT